MDSRKSSRNFGLELAANAHALAAPLRTQGVAMSLHLVRRDRGQTQHGPATVPGMARHRSFTQLLGGILGKGLSG